MPEYRDITGQRFGRLVAVEVEGRTHDKRELWMCRCDCGNTISTRKRNLITGNTQSCGCLRKEERDTDYGNSGCTICGGKRYAKGLCRNCYTKARRKATTGNEQRVKLISLDPVEMHSEMAFCIAYCIGATYENAEAIANKVSDEEVDDCIRLIRRRIQNGRDQ